MKPNVLWIMTDSLSADFLSCYGDKNIETPHIDRLANEGIRLENACSHCPVCTPFRGGLVTGQYAHVNGVRVNGDFLASDKRTIAHAFNESGYRTSYVGKWHLAATNGAKGWLAGEDFWVHPQLRGGFSDWYGFDESTNFYRSLYSHGEFIFPPGVMEGYQTESMTDLSINYLKETALNLDQPWFHVISYEAPHTGIGKEEIHENPFKQEFGGKWGCGHPAPERYEEMFDPDNLILCENVPESKKEHARRKLAGYYAMVKCIDDNVGRLLDFLDDNNLKENTLVLFFSDHGEQAGSNGCYGKEDIYRKSVNIPFILRMPGVIPANTVTDELLSGVDIFPSFAALCDVPVFPDVQGMDLSSMLKGEVGPRRSEVYFQWMGQSRYYWGDYHYRAIKTNRYTFAIYDSADKCQLFDDAADPLQMKNLYNNSEYARVKKNLYGTLCRNITSSGEEIFDYIRQEGDRIK